MPVEASVAATFWPIRPDLPMPVTQSRPEDFSMASTASRKAGPEVVDLAADGFGLDPQNLPGRFERHGRYLKASALSRIIARPCPR